MKLMIVESPGKLKKIQSLLGTGWTVKASVGHVRDLPVNDMGIDIENDFRPHYVLTERGANVVKQLRTLAQQADVIYLATDMDREGESIAWHLKMALGLKSYQRIAFAEISKTALQKALAQPRQLNMELVRAQESRRVLDRLVGYRVSPVVGNVFNRRGLSAGRVQTPAVGLVVERELAIRRFVAQDYYDVYLVFGSDAESAWCAKWQPQNLLTDHQTHWTDRAFAQQVAQVRTVRVDTYRAEPELRRPPAPFITSTLQQAASVALKLSPTDTMKLAQTLYEQGLITYMRTDNPNLSDDAVQLARQWLSANDFSNDIAADIPRWTSKEGAQEAHEAIRPTDFNVRSIHLGDPDQVRLQALYELIWLRALATQLKPAEYDTQAIHLTAQLENKPLRFVARARRLRYAGWLLLMSADRTELEDTRGDDAPESHGLPKNCALPVLVPGHTLTATRGQWVACKTKPPARFTEASLVEALESEGIGRPSTYAAIMQGLLSRGYIEVVKRKLHATELGVALFEVLNHCSFAQTTYTASIEERLDRIAHKQETFLALVGDVNRQLDGEVIQLAALKRRLPESALPTPSGRKKKPSTTNKTRSTQTKSQKKSACHDPAIKNGDACPLCQSGTVTYKTVKTGPNAGKPMYGCSDRRCRFFAWASPVS
ncbi:MAG: type I DNA topoisomerase [Pseudomonadota bacterium]